MLERTIKRNGQSNVEVGIKEKRRDVERLASVYNVDYKDVFLRY